MEERALYRAILTQPHDDAVRLAYADWLDENADALPHPAAERARAELIRLQCERARRFANGWRVGPQQPPEARERRLLFRHGRAWRGAHSVLESSAPFDRGFLRPFRALTPLHFLCLPPMVGVYWPFQPLPLRSPARRYVPEGDDPFAACPLWDVHLYAPGWLNDPLADHGQYGPLLDEVAQSPALRQVGWLKVSFLRTPVMDFLRAGQFDNVETLVLNSGPFPGVLEAVAENPSFRSLRYIQFGADRWAWAGTRLTLAQFHVLESRLRPLNDRHLPFGEMRFALRGVLRDRLPAPGPRMGPRPVLTRPLPQPGSGWLSQPTPEEERRLNRIGAFVGLAVSAVFLVAIVFSNKKSSPPTYEPVRQPAFVVPEYPKIKAMEEFDALLKRDREKALGLKLPGEREVAPPPREAKPPLAPPPRAVEE